MNSEIEDRIKRFTKRGDDLLFGTKDHDYNSGGIDVIDYYPYGVWSAITEINRKVLRLMSLYGGDKKPQNESLEDTWVDLLNYLRIGYAITMHLEAKEMPKKKKKRKGTGGKGY